MGCATALHAACQQPDRVRGLLLVIPPTAWAQRRHSTTPYRRLASVLQWTRGVPLRLLRWLPAAASAAQFRQVMNRETLRQLAAADPKAVIAALCGAALSDLPKLAQLQSLTMPALILAWPDDPLHPLTTARILAEALPAAELIISRDDADIRMWPQHIRHFLQALA